MSACSSCDVYQTMAEDKKVLSSLQKIGQHKESMIFFHIMLIGNKLKYRKRGNINLSKSFWMDHALFLKFVDKPLLSKVLYS